MISAADAPSTSATIAIDPTLLALLPFAGVLVTVLVGLFGAWVQGRREHARWIREQRYEAFVRVLGAIDDFDTFYRNSTNPSEYQKMRDVLRFGGDKVKQLISAEDAASSLMARFDEAVTPVVILGPDSVRDALREVSAARKAGDEDSRSEARWRAIAEMRRALGVKA